MNIHVLIFMSLPEGWKAHMSALARFMTTSVLCSVYSVVPRSSVTAAFWEACHSAHVRHR